MRRQGKGVSPIKDRHQTAGILRDTVLDVAVVPDWRSSHHPRLLGRVPRLQHLASAGGKCQAGRGREGREEGKGIDSTVDDLCLWRTTAGHHPLRRTEGARFVADSVLVITINYSL